MLNGKTNPDGIDIVIDNIQRKMYNYLTSNGWTNYESFGRAYKNRKGSNKIPEVYVGKNEYRECLTDDKYNASSFFIVSDTSKFNVGGLFKQDISIIFQCDLAKLYPTIMHRADEEMHGDIVNALINSGYYKSINEILTGVDRVYEGLEFNAAIKKRINNDDMSNLHVVRINLTVNYNYKNCN